MSPTLHNSSYITNQSYNKWIVCTNTHYPRVDIRDY
nr:MAG TPA: hypothetical protein [Caudoviricetes sp.]